MICVKSCFDLGKNFTYASLCGRLNVLNSVLQMSESFQSGTILIDKYSRLGQPSMSTHDENIDAFIHSS